MCCCSLLRQTQTAMSSLNMCLYIFTRLLGTSLSHFCLRQKVDDSTRPSCRLFDVTICWENPTQRKSGAAGTDSVTTLGDF